jgi:IS5 family transposase
VELGDDVVPDESTILRFRHLLEQHGLSKSIFDAIAGLLDERFERRASKRQPQQRGENCRNLTADAGCLR